MSCARWHIDKYLYRAATDSIMYVDVGETERKTISITSSNISLIVLLIQFN